MTNIYNLFYRVFQAQYVGYFRQAGKLCLFCEILTQSLQVQMTALVDGYRPDPVLCAGRSFGNPAGRICSPFVRCAETGGRT